jgi:hypothetical protein
MPEQQKPFITQSGKLSTMSTVPAAELLAPIALAGQIAELRREQEMRGRLYPAWLENKRLDQDKAFDQLTQLERAIQTLAMVQEPRTNTVLTALRQIDPTMQALVSDIVVALAVPGLGRQRFANELRQLVNGGS